MLDPNKCIFIVKEKNQIMKNLLNLKEEEEEIKLKNKILSFSKNEDLEEDFLNLKNNLNHQIFSNGDHNELNDFKFKFQIWDFLSKQFEYFKKQQFNNGFFF
jgi:hypothetical protein